MSNFRVTVYGLQQLRAKVEGLREEAEEILAEEIEATAENISSRAKKAVVGMITTAGGNDIDEVGRIRSAIRAWNSGHLQWSVGIPTLGPVNDMAGYLEFGTGIYIDIIPGMEAYAMRWYKTGKGTILPHPFLFPAAEIERSRFITQLKKDLEGL